VTDYLADTSAVWRLLREPTAEAHGLALAHADADFDAIAKVRPGIAMVRIDQPNAL
jgi:predicted nucleic acid-binding protein